VSRRRPSEEALWELLSERARRDEESTRENRAAWSSVKRESAARLLDAAAGVLAATGRFVSVAEDIVREQRDRMIAVGAEPGYDSESQPREEQSGRERIDLTY
jgi:hypothetical protein